MAEHIRIDEGIKRGKRKKDERVLPPGHPDLGTWKIPENLDPEEVIKRYLIDGKTATIAARYGVSRKALTRWLREVKPQEWREAQRLRAHTMLEDSEEQISDARDPFTLAKARELNRAAQFRLQSIDPDYAQRHQVNHNVRFTLTEKLMRAENRIAEATRHSDVIDVTPDRPPDQEQGSSAAEEPENG